MPTIKIQRDQAVWERETFEVEVPEGFDPDDEEHRDVLEHAIDTFQGYHLPGYFREILDAPVYGLSTETVFFSPDGEEHTL